MMFHVRNLIKESIQKNLMYPQIVIFAKYVAETTNCMNHYGIMEELIKKQNILASSVKKRGCFLFKKYMPLF